MFSGIIEMINNCNFFVVSVFVSEFYGVLFIVLLPNITNPVSYLRIYCSLW